MTIFDQKYLQLRLEAMKLTQGSLQQLMTLSATGLALYFSFIGKAEFIEVMRPLSALAVLSWIVSLCAAAVAHRLHGNLFLMLCNFTSTIEDVLALQNLPKEAHHDSINALVPGTVFKEAEAKLERARQNLKHELAIFKSAYFSLQTRTARLTALALSAFVIGFILLGLAYFAWIAGLQLSCSGA